ncbi:uncharacterized protein LOC112680444 [Sipha flava]|uniref:Uncharacterized protein LOC112680444 n=1 Tax=Sipha flava TaxID=143950 RepID=A0A8B8F662_9HEMI|nr:uncharacterized protein LOC112680444 [Sipha flava]
MVATFDKLSHIKYAATAVNMSMLNIFLRFYPFDMSGTILRRFFDDCNDCGSVCLSLIDCHLFLEVNIHGCNVTLLSPSTIKIGWNDVVFSISNHKVTLQLNNKNISKRIKCTDLVSIMNLDQVMNIGEEFEGYIEKLYVNFLPYALTINNKFSDMYSPYATFNTIFELSEEQSYSDLSKTIKIPCPQQSHFIKVCDKKILELYLRFELLANGNLMSIKGMTTDYMLVEINNDIIKLIVKLDDYYDEVLIQFEEIDSSWIHVEIEQQENTWIIDVNGEKRTLIMPADISNNDLCMSYNEVTMTSEEDILELNCIINNELQYEDLDIAWLKYDQPMLHKINCKM